MKSARLLPKAQIFVCANARGPDDPLTSACGAHGMAVFAAARRVVSAQGLTASLWVTRTGCLGHCPREGCAVAVYPAGGQWVDVRAEDVDALVAHAAASNLRIR